MAVAPKLSIHWVGPIFDSSGYSSATRNYIVSLIKSGQVDITAQSVTFEREKTTHELNSIISPYVKNDPGARVRVVHLTPENYPKYKSNSKATYNIGYTAWEADPIPPDWIKLCNSMDEIWVPSNWNVDVFKRSGITKKVICIPHGINIPSTTGIEPYPEERSKFWFYSISQWTERKNPQALLVAYFTEFSPDENVILALKAYRMNTSPEEKAIIKGDIEAIRSRLRLVNYPRILFFGKLLSSKEMSRLHFSGDCFVLPCRAEGWGIPFAEAMSFGNPVIGPRYGGNIDFMNDDNSFLLETRETPVFGMGWMPHYTGNMVWGDPSIMDLRKKMRYAYENQKEIRKVGEKGKKTIEEQYNWEIIGQTIINRLMEIEKERS
jgi:glycosyltransferase involved in cell wall biosynthesis